MLNCGYDFLYRGEPYKNTRRLTGVFVFLDSIELSDRDALAAQGRWFGETSRRADARIEYLRTDKD